MPLPVLLFHQDRIGQPVRVVNLPDEVCGRGLRELISDGLFSVLRESSETLLDRLCSLFDVYAMLDHLSWDSRHVGRFPSEDILVCLEEGDERAFLFVIEACPDQGRLGRIRRVERDLLDILVGTDPSLGYFLCWNFSLVLKGGSGEPDRVPVDLCLYVLR